VTLKGLPSVGNMTIDVGNFLVTHPSLIHQVAGHALAHTLYSYVRHSRKRGFSRRQMRKSSNRKRRWFVDNIIMHHRRLHNRNRELIIGNARSKVVARHEAKKKALALSHQRLQKDQKPTQWRDMAQAQVKERGSLLRNRVEARKTRAQQRWMTIKPKG